MSKFRLPAAAMATVLTCAGCAVVRGGDLAAAPVVKNESPAVLTCAKDDSPCEVVVHATVNAQGACVLTLPGRVEVSGSGVDRLMHFKLIDDSPAFHFEFSRIAFSDDPDTPQFHDPHVSADGSQLVVGNRRTVFQREFRYSVDLLRRPVGSLNKTPCGTDPVVVNIG